MKAETFYSVFGKSSLYNDFCIVLDSAYNFPSFYALSSRVIYDLLLSRWVHRFDGYSMYK
jgi:hypothetical protein